MSVTAEAMLERMRPGRPYRAQDLIPNPDWRAVSAESAPVWDAVFERFWKEVNAAKAIAKCDPRFQVLRGGWYRIAGAAAAAGCCPCGACY